MAVGDNPKQRLTDLKLREVSIVDDPANECEFNIVKRRDGMQITKAKYNEMKKNLDAASADVTETAQAAEAAAAAPNPNAADVAAKTKAAVAAIAKFRDLQKAMPPFPPKDEPDGDEAKKNAEGAGADGAGADGAGADGAANSAANAAATAPTVDQQATEVAAAATAKMIKSLGGTDIEGLKKAADASLAALHSANPEVAKSVIASVLKGELPGNTTVNTPSQVRPNEVGKVPKPEEGEMMLKMKKLEERVESVEKSRGPTAASGANDGQQDVNKGKKKGLFTGII